MLYIYNFIIEFCETTRKFQVLPTIFYNTSVICKIKFTDIKFYQYRQVYVKHIFLNFYHLSMEFMIFCGVYIIIFTFALHSHYINVCKSVQIQRTQL